MKYDDVIAGAFQPSPLGIAPEPTTNASPARRLRDAIEPIAMHSVWSRATNEALAARGLDFMQSYVWGRASLLGEPSTGLVVSSFAGFAPDLLVPVYESARAALDRDTLVRTREAATISSLSAALGDAAIAPVASALRSALGAADATARPLFAGLASQPWPDDAVGQLWRSCELLREHRGDSHNIVCVMHDLGPIAMNIVTECWLGMPLGSYSATRGWTGDQLDQAADHLRAEGWFDGESLSSDGLDRRNEIEAQTDALQRPIIDALSPEIDTLITHLDDWSQRCIDAAAFPPNAFKRAAG